ncbi:MAG: hypothetical protein GWN00_03915, partial [Aliifodinibius sp.]|nr:hypothetical protein [Fodinibius sp.]NIY23981.1 hypothetical protein [Fodinibius sp.]
MGKIEKAVLKELKTVDLTALHQYNRNSLRQTLRNISEVHTEIHDILLIDDNFRIATSTTTQNEDLVYKKPEELIHLVLREKRIVERTSDEEREELDVVWPIYIGDDYRGHIRAIIVNEGIASFNSRRTVILFALGIGFAMVFLLLTWLILRPRIRQSKPDQSPAPQAANPHHRETMPHGGEASTEDSLFSRLSRLYDKSIDLDKSFKKSEEEIHSMMRVLNHGVLILDLNMKMISYNEYLLNLFNIRTTATVQG